MERRETFADYEKLFRLWLGITEYLFRDKDLLDEVVETAIHDNTFRADDLEFTFAARVSEDAASSRDLRYIKSLLTQAQDWSDRVSFGNMDGYREKFESIQSYFAPRFPEATKLGNEMITTIEENLKARQKTG